MLDASQFFCHDQQQEMAQGGFRRTLLLHNVVYVHNHFIPSPPGFADPHHPIVTDCVGELSNDNCFDGGPHVAGAGLR
jgi:hypothetical protein